MAHSRGCWQEASVSHRLGLSTGLPECLTTWQLASLRAGDLRESKEEVTLPSMA